MKRLTANLSLCALAMGALAQASALSCAANPDDANVADSTATQPVDSVAEAIGDREAERYTSLTTKDFEIVAKELDIPVAAIRAVVEIEAGKKAEGFNPDHTPIINFDLSMFRQAARRHSINLARYRKSHAVVFAAPNTRKYGSYEKAQYARLKSAMTINRSAALESCFWGMFQIGGFNWKTCGFPSVEAFVKEMSRSELAQLEIFARFIKATGMDKYLRKLDWAGFASRYNGPGYRARGYHTRMAAAYRRYQSKQ